MQGGEAEGAEWGVGGQDPDRQRTEPSQEGAASTWTLTAPVQSPSWDCTPSPHDWGRGLGGEGRDGRGSSKGKARLPEVPQPNDVCLSLGSP